jgi:hypothetical protein
MYRELDTVGLSRKVWQKIMLLERVEPEPSE